MTDGLVTPSATKGAGRGGPSNATPALSPDGQYLLYVQTDDAGSNINVVEGLR